MKIINQRMRKRTFRFFLIFLLLTVLSVAVTLVAQQARAVTRVYSVTISTVNGEWPPPAVIPNPVELTGNFSAWPGTGLEKEHGIQIGWGDSSPYTVWRWSDANNSWPYLTWNPLDENAKYFNGTYNTNPGLGYPNLGHNYTTGGNYTITVKFFHGQPPGAESADASVSITQYVVVPEISVSKSGPTYAHESDTITYTITVSNPSNSTTMYKVSVIDSLLGDISANFSASLAPLASESKAYTYTVPAPSGDITNTVTVTYRDILNESTTASDSWTVTVLHPSIQVAKSGPLYAHEGDLITYNITVSNPSNGTMTKVSVVDSLLGDISGSFSATLAPSTSESKTFTYTVPTPSGNVSNNVTATYKNGLNQNQTASASWAVTVLHPAISMSKSGPTYAHEGDLITYTITVTNTGDCPLYSVSVIDTLLGPLYSNGLALGENKTFNVTYTVSSPSGDINNTVTASGSDVLGLGVSDQASWFVDVLHPSIDVIKSGPNYAHEGDTITYTITVNNTGDCPLSNVLVNDSLLGTIYSNGLAFGETKAFTVNYTGPTPSGDVSNTVTAIGSDALGLQVSDSASWFVKVQYQITVTASPAGAIGGTFNVTYTKSGTTYTNVQETTTWTEWVDSGTTVTVSTPQDPISDGPGTRYRFDHCDPSASVSMAGPTTITLVYKTQYYLTLQTNPAGVNAPSGAGWYDENNNASISTAQYEDIVSGSSRYRFDCWTTTDMSEITNPSATSTTVKMDKAKTVTANYVTQYNITFDQTGVGSDFTGTVVTIDSSDYDVSDLPVSFWWDENSVHTFSFASPLEVNTIKQYVWNSTSGLSTLQSGTLTITASGSVVGNYILQNAITFDQLGVGSDFTGTVVVIDSTQYGVSALPVSFYWTMGSTHNFAFQSPLVVTANPKQYVWTSTTGLSSLQSSSITVTTYGSIVGNYKTQYYLTMSTNFGTVSPGSQWHDEGSTVTISATAPSVIDGERYVWLGWTGTGTTSYSGMANPAEDSVTMNSPITETAAWRHEFRLTMSANFGTTSPSIGEHWIEAGTEVDIEAFAPSVVPGERYVWLGWTGSGLGSYTNGDNPASITMNGPITETAAWRHEYKLTMGTNFGTTTPDVGEHWYEEGTVLTMSATAPSVVDGEQYVWLSWTGTGDVSYSDMDNPALNKVTMNSPITETAAWKHEYRLTMTTNMGTTSPSVGDHWIEAGTSLDIQAFAPDPVYPADKEQYVWLGWTGSGLGSYSNGENPASITMNGPITQTAAWRHEYKLVIATNFGTTSPSAGEHWYEAGTVLTISATAPSVVDGERYIWLGWTGIGTISYSGMDNPATSSVTMNSPITETAAWTHEYRLTMATNFGTTTPSAGEHWYEAGTVVSIEAFAPSVVPGERYIWNGWTGTGNGSYTSTDNPAQVTMNEPITQTASWTHQYYLTVTSPHGTTSGEGWYDAGTTAYAGVSPLIVPGPAGTMYVFIHWSGDASGTTSPSDPITINAPKTAVANWKTQYPISPPAPLPPAPLQYQITFNQLGIGSDFTGTIITIDGSDYGFANLPISFWFDVGSTHSFSFVSPLVVNSGKRYVWASTVGLSTLQSGILTITTSGIVTGEYRTQYYLSVRTDPDGIATIPGEGWYDEGTNVTLTAPQYVYMNVDTRFRFDYWDIDTATVSGNPISVQIYDAHIATAHYVLQYYLTLATKPANITAPSGAGWYDENTYAFINTAEFVNVIGGASRYSFEGWTTDDMLEIVDPSTTFTTVLMDKAKIVTANYALQHLITFSQTGLDASANSSVVTVLGSSKTYNDLPFSIWVDDGSTITYSYEEFVQSEADDKRFKLHGVEGPVSPITVIEPLTITGNYIIQYKVTFAQTGLSSDAVGTVVTVNGSAETFGDLPFDIWVDSGDSITYSYGGTVSSSISGKRFISINVTGPGSPANVTEPFTVTGNYKTQYHLTMSTNLGTVSPSSGWYDAGLTIQISASAPSVVEGKGYAWYGWAGTGTISYSGLDNPANITVNSPITETAHWKILPELTIFVSEETIERCDRIVVQGRTLPVSSSTEVTITYTFPNGTQITHTVQTDDEGRYNDASLLAGESLYGLFDQSGQWVITANRPGDINQESATSSTTLGIAAPELSQIPPVAVALLIVIVVAASYMIIRKRTNGKKLTYKTWWHATVILGLTGLAFGAASLAFNWLSVAGTANTNGQTYLVNINLHPFSLGSVSITGLQYIGSEIPSLINSVWLSIRKSPGPVTALYLAPVGCILALASLYKPRTERQRRIKVLTLVIAGSLILVPVAQSFIFMQIHASTTAGASIGYGIGLYIAMIGGLLAILSSLFATRETPTGMKRASAS